jgi:hypothetical protein
MTHDNDGRRFTEREVAMVLRRAVDMDQDAAVETASTGLSLNELREIAGEVGIRSGAVDRAVAEMDRGRRVEPRALLGPPASQVTIRSVPGPLSLESLQDLVQVADERVSTPGIVTEALGAVRWTSQDRFLTTQVSLTPEGEGTTIRVQERLAGRVRRGLHLVSGSWGAILGLAVTASIDLPAAVVVGGATVLGLGVGRAVWSVLSGRSRARVEDLAAELERRALAAKDVS